MEVVSPSSTESSEAKAGHLVVFGLDEQRYALRLSAVDQIVRVVQITFLPKAPDIIRGVVNVRGRIVPVYDLRARFHLPNRESLLTDHLILAHTANRTVGLVADHVIGVVTKPLEEVTQAQSIFPSLEYVEGVVKLEDGLVFIHDLNTFLSIEEESLLEEAIAPARELP